MGGMTTSAISAEAEQTYRSLPFSEILEDLSSRFIVNLPKEELGSITRIGFQVEQAHWFYEDFLRPINPSLPSLSLRNFSSQLLRTASHTVPLIKQYIKSSSNKNGIQDLEAAFEEFIMYKTRVPVCGIILINKGFDKCLLVKGWKSNSTWGFPKGKINQSEPKRDCAIREVFEETGFDSTDLLKPDSNDFMDLTMKDQKIRLYIVKGVDEDTVFETRTRKEISKIAWFPLESLPTWKKSKSASDISSGKFYMVSPFVARLKQWIKVNKNRAAKDGSGGFGVDGGVAQGEDGFQDADESYEDSTNRQRSSTPTEPAAFRNNNSNPPPNAPTGPAALRQNTNRQNQSSSDHQHQQPTSEGLKALLGFSNNDSSFPSSSRNTLDSPQVSHHPVSHSANAFNSRHDPLFDGKGPNLIQQHSDPRSHQLLELLRSAAAPAMNAEHHQHQQSQPRSSYPTSQNQNSIASQSFGGSRAWEDVERQSGQDENGAASLLAALRAGSGQTGPSVNQSVSLDSTHQKQSQNQNLLNLLNGKETGNQNASSPMEPSAQMSQQVQSNRSIASRPFDPWLSAKGNPVSSEYPKPHLDQILGRQPQSQPQPQLQPPAPAISPLPAPRAQNVALTQSLLKMMSPAQGSFSFSMPPASSPDIVANHTMGGRNASHLKEEIPNTMDQSTGNLDQSQGSRSGRNLASDGKIVTNGEEEAERERARKRDALLASLMGNLQTQDGNQVVPHDQQFDNGRESQASGIPRENDQARNLLNLLNPSSASSSSGNRNLNHSSPQQPHLLPHQHSNQFQSNSTTPQNQSGSSYPSQNPFHQQEIEALYVTSNSNGNVNGNPIFFNPQAQLTNPFPQPSSNPQSSSLQSSHPLSDRETRLREAQNRDRAMNFKFPPPSSNGSANSNSSPQQVRPSGNAIGDIHRNQNANGEDISGNSHGLLSLLNGNGNAGSGPIRNHSNFQDQSKVSLNDGINNNNQSSNSLLNVLNNPSSSPQKFFNQSPLFTAERVSQPQQPRPSPNQMFHSQPLGPQMDQGWNLHPPNQNHIHQLQHQQNLLHSMNQPRLPSPSSQGYQQRNPQMRAAAQPPFQGYPNNFHVNAGFPIGGMR